VLVADDADIVVAAAATESRSEAGRREVYIMTEANGLLC
jgi:hypothetical protein